MNLKKTAGIAAIVMFAGILAACSPEVGSKE